MPIPTNALHTLALDLPAQERDARMLVTVNTTAVLRCMLRDARTKREGEASLIPMRVPQRSVRTNGTIATPATRASAAVEDVVLLTRDGPRTNCASRRKFIERTICYIVNPSNVMSYLFLGNHGESRKL